MRKLIMTFRKICKCTFHSHLIINLMASDFMAKNRLHLIISKPMYKNDSEVNVLKEQTAIKKSHSDKKIFKKINWSIDLCFNIEIQENVFEKQKFQLYFFPHLTSK